MKRTLIFLSLFVVIALPAFGQEGFQVGQTVLTGDGRQCQIVSITGRAARVRCGPNQSDVRLYRLDSLSSAAIREQPQQPPAQPIMSSPPASSRSEQRQQAQAQAILRQQFLKEADPFLDTLALTARAYDPKYKQAASFTINPALAEKVRKDLEGLHDVCQRYPGLTISPDADPPNIRNNPAELCKMAENPAEMAAKATGVVAGIRGEQNIGRWTRKVNEAVNQREGRIKDDIQMLLYNRDEWERTELDSVRKRYAGFGNAVPPAVLAPLNEKADELKAQIARDAPNRTWKQPTYSDPALEAMIKRAYPAKFPGVKILKTGMTYTTWKAYDDTSLVRSEGDYKIYLIEKDKYRYKLGLALVKFPNQPFCQIREFELQQTRTGAGYSAPKVLGIGASGIFVKCD